MSATREGAGRSARPSPTSRPRVTCRRDTRRSPSDFRRVRSRLQDVGRSDVPEAGRRVRELDEAIRAVVNSRFGSGFAVEYLDVMRACATMLETRFS